MALGWFPTKCSPEEAWELLNLSPTAHFSQTLPSPVLSRDRKASVRLQQPPGPLFRPFQLAYPRASRGTDSGGRSGRVTPLHVAPCDLEQAPAPSGPTFTLLIHCRPSCQPPGFGVAVWLLPASSQLSMLSPPPGSSAPLQINAYPPATLQPSVSSTRKSSWPPSRVRSLCNKSVALRCDYFPLGLCVGRFFLSFVFSCLSH